MSERKKYSAGAVKVCFWFGEFRKVVSLLNEGMSIDKVKTLNQHENIFSAPSILRSNQIFSTVSARIGSLDSSFYPLFLESDLATQKLFALVGAMAYDALFFDLFYEVIREKMIIGTNELSDSDIRIFFHAKQEQDERAAKWTEQTIGKLSTSYKSMLYEAGLTNKAKRVRQIYKPILGREMEQWLEGHGLSVMIKALTGVR